MISATHTHSGPTLTRDSLMDDITGGKTPQTLDYMNEAQGTTAAVFAHASGAPQQGVEPRPMR